MQFWLYSVNSLEQVHFGQDNFAGFLNIIKHSEQDALDELNGRTYDGRELRIKIDEGRPK